MSLMVYDKYDAENGATPSDKPVTQVSKLFSTRSEIPDTPEVRKLLKEIDNADYINKTVFQSNAFSFGVHNVNRLSAGCKTALCVYLFPDIYIDTISCGVNARNQILLLHDGKIYFRPTFLLLPEYTPCDIVYKGEHFDKLKSFFKWRYAHGFSK